MARILKTRRAEQDLVDIWDHIAEDSLEAADRWLDALLDKARLLADQPHLGRSRPDLVPDLAPDLRSFPIRAYVIFYRPVTGGVEIIRVLHGARDLDPAFLRAW